MMSSNLYPVNFSDNAGYIISIHRISVTYIDNYSYTYSLCYVTLSLVLFNLAKATFKHQSKSEPTDMVLIGTKSVTLTGQGETLSFVYGQDHLCKINIGTLANHEAINCGCYIRVFCCC